MIQTKEIERMTSGTSAERAFISFLLGLLQLRGRPLPPSLDYGPRFAFSFRVEFDEEVTKLRKSLNDDSVLLNLLKDRMGKYSQPTPEVYVRELSDYLDAVLRFFKEQASNSKPSASNPTPPSNPWR